MYVHRAVRDMHYMHTWFRGHIGGRVRSGPERGEGGWACDGAYMVIRSHCSVAGRHAAVIKVRAKNSHGVRD